MTVFINKKISRRKLKKEPKNKYNYIHIKLFATVVSLHRTLHCIVIVCLCVCFILVALNQTNESIKAIIESSWCQHLPHTIVSLRLWRGNQSMQSFTLNQANHLLNQSCESQPQSAKSHLFILTFASQTLTLGS